MNNKNLLWVYILSASIYFSQGIDTLSSLPLFFYMKETLGFTEAKIMFLTSFITLAWLFKPVIGFIIDNLRISKKKWIMISLIGILSVVTALGFLPALPILVIIGLMMVSSTFGAWKDVAVDGEMVIIGKETESSGAIQSLQWIFLTIATVITGFLGGYIAEHYTYRTAFLILIPIYLIVIGIVSLYKSKQTVIQTKKTHILKQMKVLFTDKKLLLVCLVIFLYKFSPSFGTPLMFIMRDTFGWKATTIGLLETVSAIVSIGGALLYFKFSKKLNMMKWLKWSVVVGAVCSLSYLYFTPVSCVVYNIIFSFMGMAISLLLLDFMARNSKSGLEATSFALLCSVSNLAATCSGFAGSWLFPVVGLKWLIVISSFASFTCLLVLPFIKEEK